MGLYSVVMGMGQLIGAVLGGLYVYRQFLWVDGFLGCHGTCLAGSVLSMRVLDQGLLEP